jgi:hypothetical protein
MDRQFDEDGVSFRYPDDWRLEREEDEDGWAVTLHSPGTAFALVRLDRSMPPAEDVATTVLEALRSDYPDLEAEPCVDMLAGEMAVGHDMQFLSLDLSNTCRTRVIYAAAGTLLVLCQVNDLEEEERDPALRAICASLRAEGD